MFKLNILKASYPLRLQQKIKKNERACGFMESGLCDMQEP